MEKLCSPLFVLLVSIMVAKAQGSADQWKYSSSNPSGTRYADFAPKDKPVRTPSNNYPSTHTTSNTTTNSGDGIKHAPTYTPDQPMYHTREAGAAMYDHDYAKAEKEYTIALKLIGDDNYEHYYNEQDDAVYFMRANCRFYVKDYKNALKDCEMAAKYEKSRSEAIARLKARILEAAPELRN